MGNLEDTTNTIPVNEMAPPDPQSPLESTEFSDVNQVQSNTQASVEQTTSPEEEDMYQYIPTTSSDMIKGMTKKLGGTSDKSFLPKNQLIKGFKGFADYISNLAEHPENTNKLIKALSSYIAYYSILTGKRNDDDYVRLENSDLDTVFNENYSTSPQIVIKTLENIFKEIANAYGNNELMKAVNLLHSGAESNVNGGVNLIDNFEDLLRITVEKDDGAIMKEIILQNPLNDTLEASTNTIDASDKNPPIALAA